MLHKELTQQVINAAKAVHAELGPGLPHNFYREAMELELREVGVAVEFEPRQHLGHVARDIDAGDGIALPFKRVGTGRAGPSIPAGWPGRSQWLF